MYMARNLRASNIVRFGFGTFIRLRKFSSTCDSSEKPIDIVFSQEGRVATLYLQRASVHNAFNEPLIKALRESFENFSTNRNLRAVVLAAKGKSFSAGADLNWMKKMGNDTFEENFIDAQQLLEMFLAIKRCPFPVIGRIQGTAMGGGVGLISACDFSFALSSCQFALTEVKLGLIPAVISPLVMSKISATNCSRYFLTGEKFNASTAVRIGLIQEEFASMTELDQRIETVVGFILENSSTAMSQCKELIATVASMPYSVLFENKNSDSNKDDRTKISDYICNAIATARKSQDAQARLSAFLNKQTQK